MKNDHQSLPNQFFHSIGSGITSLVEPTPTYLTTQWSSRSFPIANFGPNEKTLAAYRENQNINGDNAPYYLLEETAAKPATKGLTTFEAYTTCINMYVGMSLLSMGYGMMVGGYLQIISLAWVMLAGTYTGLLMVECFEKYDGPEISYERLGGFAMGIIGPRWKQIGIYMVAISVTVEFIGFSAIAYVFFFRHAYMLFSGLFDFHVVVLASTALLFPTAFALNFTEMTIWSLVGTIAPTCAVLACLGIFIVNYERFNDHTYEMYNYEGTGLSAGIFLFALGGHAALPSVYNSMERKQDFPLMVRAVFLTMFVLYTAVALSCLFTFGSETNILITENYAEWPGGAVIKILIIIMLLKCMSLLPGNLNMVCEIPEGMLGFHNKPNMKRLIRGTSFILVCALGWLARDHLDFLEAITGATCTMATSVLFPILFYILILWPELSFCGRLGNVLALLLSLALTVWFTWQNFRNLKGEV